MERGGGVLCPSPHFAKQCLCSSFVFVIISRNIKQFCPQLPENASETLIFSQFWGKGSLQTSSQGFSPLVLTAFFFFHSYPVGIGVLVLLRAILCVCRLWLPVPRLPMDARLGPHHSRCLSTGRMNDREGEIFKPLSPMDWKLCWFAVEGVAYGYCKGLKSQALLHQSVVARTVLHIINLRK